MEIKFNIIYLLALLVLAVTMLSALSGATVAIYCFFLQDIGIPTNGLSLWGILTWAGFAAGAILFFISTLVDVEMTLICPEEEEEDQQASPDDKDSENNSQHGESDDV